MRTQVLTTVKCPAPRCTASSESGQFLQPWGPGLGLKGIEIEWVPPLLCARCFKSITRVNSRNSPPVGIPLSW